MKKLGIIDHISSQHTIVVRSNFAPSIGKNNIVRNANNEKIGYIYDIIGPVKSPYVLVKPLLKPQDYSKLVGETLYIKDITQIIRKNK